MTEGVYLIQTQALRTLTESPFPNPFFEYVEARTLNRIIFRVRGRG